LSKLLSSHHPRYFESTKKGDGMDGRVVDLTHVIEPTSEHAERKFVVKMHDALQEVP
jgi:hypothetical protein